MIQILQEQINEKEQELLNYLNFDNLEQFKDFGINIEEVKRFIEETFDRKIVILLSIEETLKPTEAIILTDESARYYPQYELFRESLRPKPKGWIEIFHNFKGEEE